MKKICSENAIGQVLCHDMTAILEDGFKGVRFKRGHLITEEDLPVLRSMGKDHIFVWEPELDEVHEDDCAIAFSKALLGKHMLAGSPSEGKISLKTNTMGVLTINLQALKEINSIQDWTLASVQNYQPLLEGMVFAGFRIIPLVTRQKNLDKAVAAAKNAADSGFPVFRIHPMRHLKVGLVITGNEIFYKRIPDAFEFILRRKLSRYPADLASVIFCPDDEAAILDALSALQKQCCQLILMTGGMSVDPDDVTPQAIRQSGAKILMQGVPMQPGNMLTLAELDELTILGVPGASMHVPRTSLDVFLPRLFAGLPFNKVEIARLGAGGLAVPGIPLPWPTLPLDEEELSGFVK
ncbi:MAG: molybdopterin-binding protein [Anaerolineaceae bacterium]|nr:molybdopterin-binding protein [Anaerolineaceae bacterium]